MPTTAFTNVLTKVAKAMKAIATRHNRSMEQKVGDPREGYVAERHAVLDQIEAGWQTQTRRPTAAEVDAWMTVGCP